MERERIIDAHTHIFPAKIAQKAVSSIGDFYSLKMHREGTAEALLESGAAIGVEKYLVCSTATRPEQVVSINDFIYEQCRVHPEFIGFATLHPDMDDPEAEIGRILERGYYGIKLHPDFQEFAIDDDKAMVLYRLLEGKLPILFHTGDDRYEYSRPAKLARVNERYPDLVCIAAHFGGYRRWEEAYESYRSPNVYMDTCSALFELDEGTICRFFERFGTDHFFFGTDFPMWDHTDELARFNRLKLTPQERRGILADHFENAVIRRNPAGGMRFPEE